MFLELRSEIKHGYALRDNGCFSKRKASGHVLEYVRKEPMGQSDGVRIKKNQFFFQTNNCIRISFFIPFRMLCIQTYKSKAINSRQKRNKSSLKRLNFISICFLFLIRSYFVFIVIFVVVDFNVFLRQKAGPDSTLCFY